MQPQLSIILPCYNPPKDWEKIVVESFQKLAALTTNSIELILVNDGSKKGLSKEHLAYIENEIASFKLVSYDTNRGKGYALRQGVAASTGKLKIYTDIDFPYELESMIAIFSKLNKGSEVVLGKRGQSYYDKTPWIRKRISKTLRWFLKNFLRLPTDDSQCGLKGFNEEGAKVFLDTQIDRFLFDLEFIKLSAKRKKRIALQEVELKPNIIFSKVGFGILFRESLNFIKVLFRK